MNRTILYCDFVDEEEMPCNAEGDFSSEGVAEAEGWVKDLAQTEEQNEGVEIWVCPDCVTPELIESNKKIEEKWAKAETERLAACNVEVVKISFSGDFSHREILADKLVELAEKIRGYSWSQRCSVVTKDYSLCVTEIKKEW